jgi:TorA maturation chaperone TorD
MNQMTRIEGERFSQVMALLFSPPDEEMIEQMAKGNLSAFVAPYVLSWVETRAFWKDGSSRRIRRFLTHLREEYDRLFRNPGGETISLVESFYKPWSLDPGCPLAFASKKGLLMGDSALHLLEVYRQCGLEMAEEFKSCPDHLVIELEFLSYLYQQATQANIQTFISDHLDWIPLLREELKRFQPNSFYGHVLEILDLFLKKEGEPEAEGNGAKTILERFFLSWPWEASSC